MKGMFTPRGFVMRAGGVVLAFLVVHLAGWRESVTLLSGTSPAEGGARWWDAVQAVTYLLSYFGVVLAVPVLLLGAALLALLQRRQKMVE